METVTLNLPKSLYDAVAEQAAARQQTPEGFVQELLIEQLSPSHPYVEIVQGRSGSHAMIKGTRVGVDVIRGYAQAGYTPSEIATDILPHISLAQVYDALGFYEDHRPFMEQALQANTVEAWRERLRRRMGVAAADRLLGN
jgi:uncharacterized protein (DUF433 family)